MREKGRSEWDILPGRGQALWRPLCLLPLISNQAKASATSAFSRSNLCNKSGVTLFILKNENIFRVGGNKLLLYCLFSSSCKGSCWG